MRVTIKPRQVRALMGILTTHILDKKINGDTDIVLQNEEAGTVTVHYPNGKENECEPDTENKSTE